MIAQSITMRIEDPFMGLAGQGWEKQGEKISRNWGYTVSRHFLYPINM